MKKNILLINSNPWTYENERIKEEAEKQNINLYNTYFYDTNFQITPQQIILNPEIKLDPLNTYVIARNINAKNLHHNKNPFEISTLNLFLKELKQLQIPTLNLETILTYPFFEDKFNQSVFFQKHNLPGIFPTYLFHSKSNLEINYDKLEFPLIQKPRYGSGGKGIRLINSIEKFKTLEETNELSYYIYQKFIPNDFDLRVWATPEKIIGIMKKTRSTGITNNYATGATIEKYTSTDTNIKQTATKLCQLLNANYLGIDIIYNKNTNEMHILEVNRYCQFKGFELSTDINIAKIMVDMVQAV